MPIASAFLLIYPQYIREIAQLFFLMETNSCDGENLKFSSPFRSRAAQK